MIPDLPAQGNKFLRPLSPVQGGNPLRERGNRWNPRGWICVFLAMGLLAQGLFAGEEMEGAGRSAQAVVGENGFSHTSADGENEASPTSDTWENKASQKPVSGEPYPEDFLVMEGEGLTVTATVELTQQVVRIEEEEIQRLQAPDVTSLLERAFQAGITRNGPYGSVTGVSIRGYGSGRVAVLIDGVPVNSHQTGGFDFNRLSPEDLEAVEVVYGGADTRFAYSGAQGGVVNLITRRGKGKEEGSRWDVTVANQVFLPEPYITPTNDKVWPPLTDLGDTQKLRLGWETSHGREGWKAGLEAVRAGNHFLYQDPQYKVRRRTGGEVKDLRGELSYLWDPGTGQQLLLSGSVYWGDKGVPGPLNSANPGKQEDRYGKTALHYSREGLWGEGSITDLILSYAYEGTDYTDLTGKTSQGLHTATGIIQGEILAGDAVVLRPSVDAAFGYLDSSNLGTRGRPQGGAALGVEYSPTPHFTILPFVKMIVTESTLMPVPKLGFLYRASDTVTLKHNWFRTFRFPTLNDLYWPEDAFAQGNPDLKPEDGVGTDVILELSQPGKFLLTASLYATYQKDAITWQPGSGGKWSPTNLAEALYFGSDLRVQSEVNPNLRVTASYGWLLTYVLTGELALKDDKRMPYQPVHRFGAGVEILWNTGSLVISQKYESERYATIVNAAPLPPYFTLDVSLTQHLGDSWTLLLSGANLLGANYQLIENYPLPRTSLSVGLRYRHKGRGQKAPPVL